jgi:hypothetical protein
MATHDKNHVKSPNVKRPGFIRLLQRGFIGIPDNNPASVPPTPAAEPPLTPVDKLSGILILKNLPPEPIGRRQLRIYLRRYRCVLETVNAAHRLEPA